MLATIREFAQERLRESGDEAATHERHARFFLTLAERAGPEFSEAVDPVWLDVIERDHDNLRAALGWGQETRDHDTLIRVAAALAFFWYYRGHLNEGRRWLSLALETPPDDAAPRPRAWALMVSGLLASVSGETDRATELLTESFSWWEQTGDAWGYASARSLLGGVSVSQGQYDEAAALFEANELYFRDSGRDNIMLGHARFHLGLIAWVQGDDARARSLLRDTMERYDRSGAQADAIDPLRYLGLISCAAGELDDAAKWFGEELTRLRSGQPRRPRGGAGRRGDARGGAPGPGSQPYASLPRRRRCAQTEAAAFSLPARDHYERAHARARETLGEAAYQATAVAGRALSLEQVLQEAEAVLAEGDDSGGDATS